MNLEIHHLFRHPEQIRCVATWIYDAFWRGREGYSVELFDGLLRKADHPDRIPLSLLALADGRPAGTVNLVENDDSSRLHLRPWLAALVVVEDLRERGIGSALVRCLAGEALRLGVDTLYLGADIPDYYARFGAVRHEKASETLWIMRLDTAGAATPRGTAPATRP